MNRPINTSSRSLASGRLAKRLPALALGALVLSLALVPAAQAANPETNGIVQAVISDGQGGSYIGGSFTRVNGSNATYLAHVKADGSLDTDFAPGITSVTGGGVNALASSGSNLYFGGKFGSVGGQTRNNAAAVSAFDGAVQSWNPNANNTVRALVISGSQVYLGGEFTQVKGTGRTRLAAVGTDDTLTTAFASATLGNTVNTLAINGSGSTLYVGGGFAAKLTAVKTSDGSVDTSFAPATINNSVTALAVSGSTVYVGGNFTAVGTAPRNRLAAFGADGSLTAFAPDPNLQVNSIVVDKSTVYIGGLFSNVGGTSRGRFAVLGTDGTLKSLNPTVGSGGSAVNAISVAPGSQIMVGGNFTTLNSASQSYLAALSVGTPQTPAIDSVPATPVDKGTTIKSSGYSDSPMPLFEWQRCLVLNDSSSCTVTIAGQSGAWYGTRDADIGYQVRVRTYWQTVSGVVEAFSALSGIVVPVGTVAPALSSQSPKVGTNIASSFGTWQGWITNTSTVAYEWQQCNTSSSNVCSAIAGAPNAANYKPVAGSVGKYLRVKVTITTRGQSASQFSAITTNAIAS